MTSAQGSTAAGSCAIRLNRALDTMCSSGRTVSILVQARTGSTRVSI
ncbi:Uncharacterised protein [Mycobacteroides abscessus subsp. abscessus]|nr:Uncharacterised protein [Mycobacteroides abscessus subsp. abscessus]